MFIKRNTHLICQKFRLYPLLLLVLVISSACFSQNAFAQQMQSPKVFQQDEQKQDKSNENKKLDSDETPAIEILPDVEEHNNESANPDKQLEQENVKTAELNVIKNVEADVQAARDQIEKTQAELKEDKKELAVVTAHAPNSLSLPEDGLVRERKETIEKKEESVASTQEFISHKVEAYQWITALIEKKIRVMRDEALDSDAFKKEQKEIVLMMKDFKKRQKKLEHELDLKNRELTSLMTHQDTQKLLIELKDIPAYRDAMDSVEEQVASTKIQIDHLKGRLELITLELKVLVDYYEELRKARWTRLKRDLSNASKSKVSFVEIMNMVVLLVVLLLFVVKYKRIKLFLAENKYCGSRRLSVFFIYILAISFASLFAYFLMMVLGFHPLAQYAGERIFNSLAVVIGVLLIYKVIKGLVTAFIYGRDSGESNQDSKINHPYIELFFTLLWWMLFGLIVVACMSIWNVKFESIDLLEKIFHYPLFSMGDVVVTPQSILKIIIVVWLFIFASRLISNILSQTIYPRVGLDESVQYAISVVIKYAMFITGVFIGFQMIGIRMTALTVFAGTLGIGIGFGLQDIAKNFISGIIILLERPIKIGDYVEVGDLPGKVQAINARSTVVNTFDNISVVVPNSDFMSQQVVNWSYSDRIIRIPISVGVAYGSDVNLVMKLLIEVAKNHEKVLSSPQPTVWFEEFGDSSLNFKLFAWTKEPENRFLIRSQVNTAIDAAFRKNNVIIPFPQRDLHLKSSEISLDGSKLQKKDEKDAQGNEQKSAAEGSDEDLRSQPSPVETLEEIEKSRLEKKRQEDDQKDKEGKK